MLVTVDLSIDLLAFIELEQYLSEKLGMKVDLVMKDALKPYIGKQILKEVIYV
ncbi:MAG: nucleotidyltransferase family protein [Candidatus Hodarchaeales archaeon]